MRTTRMAVVAAVSALALAVVGCGSTKDLDSGSGSGTQQNNSTGYQLKAATSLSGSVQAIKDKGKLVVGTKFDQPGFGLQNPTTQKVEGFDAEIARLISIKIFGSPDKVEFKEAKTAVREQVIQNGEVDLVVATYTINDARKQKIDFAGPYFQAGQDILVRKDNSTIASVTDLAGKKVCTQQNSTSLKNLQDKVPGLKAQTLDSYALCAEGVKDGTYDALSTDNVILLGLVSKSPDELKVVNKPFTTEPYGIGLKKGDTALRSFVNDALDEVFTNGDWDKAWAKTAGQFLPQAPAKPSVDRY
ncbi:glutamate ABC transporter substrate-binding protein [Rugosimonospora africana]|uniref:Glutamate-binding protein n=1 Tax=Rugosimonospora africana TaxID=556532 RepID=A0A8J3VWD9_9ACTN|nr:glutamate ABC transporter substrate-binding protein [Rugosimonospora africana]GIH20844.1 glutamate-binding protein [Rugosimonospora africana]